jgi:hypothetical protein
VSAAIIISVISVVVVCASVAIAYIQYRENHKTKVDDDLHEVIRQIAHQANEPLQTQLTDHTLRFTQTGDRLNRIEDLIKTNSSDLRSATETMTKMGVKVDMYWSTLEALAMNSAKGLHQPDPRRARVDYLLEAFMEGTLTNGERLELKKFLVQIRNYEPGGPELSFPVYPGEHTLATILLSTIDVVDPAHMAAMGHAAHRSSAHRQVKGRNDE